MKMDILPCNNENLLANFPPLLRKNFKELFCSSKVGLYPMSLSDISSTKQYTENDSTYSYHYTMKIPYAGRRLSWEVIFDPEDMSFAPDFNFNDDTFYMSTDLELVIENITTLANWNVNDPKALGQVLKEFLNLYKKQQLMKMQTENIYAQLNSEYMTLVEEIPAKDVELYLENTGAHFLISIKLDITSLPEYTQPIGTQDLLNPGEDTCFLKISYLKLDRSRINTSLQLSPRLDQILTKFHLPNYSKAESLADYVNQTTKLLQDQIKKLEENRKLRKEFMTCLCVKFAESMIAYDSEGFTTAKLLWEIGDSHYYVEIEIGDHFPEEKPTVTLHSVYCQPMSKSCSERIGEYLYSPRWSPEEMLKKLLVFLVTKTSQFRNHKH